MNVNVSYKAQGCRTRFVKTDFLKRNLKEDQGLEKTSENPSSSRVHRIGFYLGD